MRWRDQLYRRGCERPRFVVTASRWTKDDVCKSYNIADDKVVVIERSTVLFEQLLDGTRKGRLPDNLPRDGCFIFYPAFTHPHKNHLRLLQALASLLSQGKLTFRLVCSGRTSGAAWTSIQACIGELGLTDRVSFVGSVSDEEMVGLKRRIC